MRGVAVVHRTFRRPWLSTDAASRPPGPPVLAHNPVVTTRRSELDWHLARAGGALRIRDHPDLDWTIRAGLRAGTLVRPVPGVVVASALVDDPDVRIMAAARWRPGGVLLSRAAARVGFDPGIRVDDVTVTGRRTATRPGFRVVEDFVDPRYIRIRGPLRFSAPSLTVIDLLRDGDDDPLYDALRRRVVSLHSVRRALSAHPQRAGNTEVRRLLWRARENPWSRGEAELHDFLRRFAIAGWKGNVRLQIRGSVYYIDALFGRERLALELDGVEHHSNTIDREYDYRRRALLMAHGYRVLGLTLGMIRADPERVAWEIGAARAITRPPDPRATGVPWGNSR